VLVPFAGKWRGTVTGRNAGFSQRIVVSGAASGNGAYDGVVGTSFVFDGGAVEPQWNNDAGSGWQESAVISAIGMSSPLVVVAFLSADDNFPDQRDGDFDDLQVSFEHLDPAFEVVQRPYALERGSLTMLPDGIFDSSQGVQYMGVRLRNTWFFDWVSAPIATGMKIGVAPSSRAALAAQGISVLDSWSPAEQRALGQIVDGGYVRVPDLKVGEETTIFFKLDVADGPSKPDVGLVAQRDAFDPRFDAPSRVAHKQIFVSRSSYDKTTKELVAALPEGTLHLKFSAITLDLKAANDAAKDLRACLAKDGGQGGGSWWDRPPSPEECRKLGSRVLRELLEDVLAGREVDLCALRDVLDRCCGGHHECDCCGGGGDDGDGWGDGTGVDGWCRVKPVAWLPVAFDYRLEPNPAYTGQFGPLAFEDPWWKIVLIILAILLEIASLVYDYVEAGQDPQFIIGQIARNGDAMTNAIDCAVCTLNGSRGVDLGELDAQGDDANNGLPIEALDSIIQLDRTDNGDAGIQDAVLHNVVWKSGGRSGTTRGRVESLVYSTFVTYDTEDTITGQVTFTDQVLVKQITGMEQPVSQAGDSGSVWVDMATKRPVALNFAGDTDDAGTDAVGNPIRDVVDRLDIRFNP
jgi:hypothetical protein